MTAGSGVVAMERSWFLGCVFWWVVLGGDSFGVWTGGPLSVEGAWWGFRRMC